MPHPNSHEIGTGLLDIAAGTPVDAHLPAPGCTLPAGYKLAAGCTELATLIPRPGGVSG